MEYFREIVLPLIICKMNYKSIRVYYLQLMQYHFATYSPVDARYTCYRYSIYVFEHFTWFITCRPSIFTTSCLISIQNDYLSIGWVHQIFCVTGLPGDSRTDLIAKSWHFKLSPEWHILWRLAEYFSLRLALISTSEKYSICQVWICVKLWYLGSQNT